MRSIHVLTFCDFLVGNDQKHGDILLLQIAATGEEALENLEELEIIFGGVSELGSLERCTRLRSLTRAAEMRFFFAFCVLLTRSCFAILPAWKIMPFIVYTLSPVLSSAWGRDTAY